MMPNTTNHNVLLPTVGASADTWGGENNNAHQSWDTLTSGAQNTILGRVASGAGPMTQLTSAQATSALTAVVGDSGSGGTKGLVPAPAAGDAASRKSLLASGGWGFAGAVALGRFVGSTGATTKARGISANRTGVGLFSITLSPAMSDTDYIIQVDVETTLLTAALPGISGKTTSGFNLDFRRYNAAGPTYDNYDPNFISICIQTV